MSDIKCSHCGSTEDVIYGHTSENFPWCIKCVDNPDLIPVFYKEHNMHDFTYYAATKMIRPINRSSSTETKPWFSKLEEEYAKR